MTRYRKLLGFWVGLGGVSLAFAAGAMETPTAKGQFPSIDQPLGLKVGVTLVGLSLIALELWWFLGSKPQIKPSLLEAGIQKLRIEVNGGYTPSRVIVKVGQPVEITFLRTDPSSCLEKVLIPEFQMAIDLPLNKVVTVAFTPPNSGEFPFSCGMNMFRGMIRVED
jgi:plastocyanin domain-containing protein